MRDGSTVHVRPVRADDADAFRAFLEALSPESIGFRFFGTPNLDWVTDWAVDVDDADRFALVAESGSPPSVIAHAAYFTNEGGKSAEVGFMVADAWQAHGISTILLAHLAEVADRRGISTFTAEVLPANHRMIEVFRDSGFPVDMRATPEAIAIELPTSLSAEAIERFEERERSRRCAVSRSHSRSR
ncbi:MAG TPA: GNAT family N-acetyltransferase [Solirubrobacteraceae bacterium]